MEELMTVPCRPSEFPILPGLGSSQREWEAEE